MAIAHSCNSAGNTHDLVTHLNEVANNSRQYAKKFGASELGYWVGLWHDLGKFHPDFQAYLAILDERRGPDHKGAGAVTALEHNEMLSFLIAGHHGGLKSKADLKNWLRERKNSPDVLKAIECAKTELTSLKPSVPLIFPRRFHSELDLEFFIRMLFSALVDADFCDTENHFHPDLTVQRQNDVSLSTLWEHFEANQIKITGKQKDRLSTARHSIYKDCLRAAELPQGFFRLTVPTGGGKTRSGMAFALRHALKHDLDRVIFAIPYTSIIEQTVVVYRGIFGSPNVLEHHSAMNISESENHASRQEIWQRLAAQNWDAPIVVSTTVQLFESLFANRTTACRKLHNIAKSVIILDEVQTLPAKFLCPILDVLRQLVAHYGTSVVLCTATQPALNDSPYLKGLENVREIVPDPARYFFELKRVEYEWPRKGERKTWGQVADEMRKEKQSLAVVNTKANAMSLLNALDDPEALHLSTQMCGAHRHDTLEKIKTLLKERKPCRLVSTQVVEAGVDLDFPFVLRAVGPLDRIVQAAGRCNREGRLSSGRVLVFEPEGGGLPKGEYRTAKESTLKILRSQDFDFHNPQGYEKYFRQLFQLVDLDAKGIQALRKSLDFPKVAQEFRLIENETVPVVVKYECKADSQSESKREKQIESLLILLQRSEEKPPRWVWHKLQPYLVNIYQHELFQYQKKDLVKELRPGLWEWHGVYDSKRGLIPSKLDAESLVV